MTGKETLEKYSKSEYNEFVSKGISDDFSKRYKSIEDIELKFNQLIKNLK